MKHGLLRYDPKDGVRKNIGDYIQSLAAKQFLDDEPILVEREELNSYQGEPIKLIMNAWWMHKPENFPPSEQISPLFLSFHVTPKVAKRMLNETTISYLKGFEPIGCRDTGTVELLESYGIKTYFSGCLTLALGMSYKAQPEPGKVIIINPQFTRPPLNKLKNLLPALTSCIGKYQKLKAISKKLYLSDSLLSVLKTTYFYNAYSKKFDDQLLMDADYYTHGVDIKEFSNEAERFEYADKLLKTYCRASLVITSRLHAALPCVAMGVPTIFIYGEDIPRSAGRFGGLLEHVNCLQYKNKNWVGLDGFCVEGKISKDTQILNKNTHQSLADKMAEAIRAFLQK